MPQETISKGMVTKLMTDSSGTAVDTGNETVSSVDGEKITAIVEFSYSVLRMGKIKTFSG